MIPIQIATAKRVSTGDWWAELTKSQKEDYIKKHPHSKYADRHAEENQEAKEKEVKKVKVSHHFKKHWSKFSDDQKDFFGRGDHKAGSKERRKLGDIIKSKAKGVVKAVKHEVDEWKDAGKGVKKLATGKKLSSHEKHAIKNVAIHAAMVIGPMAISGGLSAGLASASKGIGLGLLEHTALLRGVQIAAFASADDIDPSMSEEEALEVLIKQMGDAMATAKIKDSDWAAASIKNK